jgi:hypothetical protein
MRASGPPGSASPRKATRDLQRRRRSTKEGERRVGHGKSVQRRPDRGATRLRSGSLKGRPFLRGQLSQTLRRRGSGCACGGDRGARHRGEGRGARAARGPDDARYAAASAFALTLHAAWSGSRVADPSNRLLRSPALPRRRSWREGARTSGTGRGRRPNGPPSAEVPPLGLPPRPGRHTGRPALSAPTPPCRGSIRFPRCVASRRAYNGQRSRTANRFSSDGSLSLGSEEAAECPRTTTF